MDDQLDVSSRLGRGTRTDHVREKRFVFSGTLAIIGVIGMIAAGAAGGAGAGLGIAALVKVSDSCEWVCECMCACMYCMCLHACAVCACTYVRYVRACMYSVCVDILWDGTVEYNA